jgi:hypothetical protein
MAAADARSGHDLDCGKWQRGSRRAGNSKSSIQWANDLDEALPQATFAGKYILIDFFNPM